MPGEVVSSSLSSVASTPAEMVRAARRPVAVLWIDWYAYHVARLRALTEHAALRGRVIGLEMVGGVGVHQGLLFRDGERASLPIRTLLPSMGWREAGQRRVAWEVWRALEEADPEVVLVPGYYNLPALAAALWAKVHGRTTVLMTESTQQDHQRTAWKENAKGLLIRTLFDWAVAGGAPHMRYLRALGFPQSRIARHYDVVDNHYYVAGTNALRLHSSHHEQGLPEHYFLYVGRLAPEKNVDGLLAAYAEYRRRGGDWSLVLVGDGPLAGALRAQVDQLGLASHVVFAGLRNAAELLPCYAFADCFVLPSTREPWGLVVNEAMASGLPVIVSRQCGCAEDLVLHGSNGLLFDSAQRGELTEALLTMTSAGTAGRARMGRASQEIINRHSPEDWAAEVARIAAS